MDFDELVEENKRLAARVKELEALAENKRQAEEMLTVAPGADQIDARSLQIDEDGGSTTTTSKHNNEPTGFRAILLSRALWLSMLLAFQSGSSVILAGNEALISAHPSVVFFLTMLVGAGGNAGNQSAVRVIRDLATGNIKPTERLQCVLRELKIAFALAAIMTCVGFARVAIFGAPLLDTVAISLALYATVFLSVLTGAILPLVMESLGFDPAHAATTIQVIMDIAGVLILCAVCTTFLDRGPWLASAFHLVR